MALVDANPAITWKKFSAHKKGDVLVEMGTFLRREESANYPGQFNYLFEEVATGTIIGLNGCGSLNRSYEKLKTLIPGVEYQIVFQGKVVMEEGRFRGKEANSVQVLYDKDKFPKLRVQQLKAEPLVEDADDLLG